EALETVRHECRTLVRRLPGLLELNFSDGTPFADDSTRSWLQDLAAAQEDGGEGASPAGASRPAAAASSNGDADFAAALAKIGTPSARELPEAARVLGELAEGAPDQRRRFLRRLALARIMAKADARLAVAHLDRLEAAIRRHGLEE